MAHEKQSCNVDETLNEETLLQTFQAISSDEKHVHSKEFNPEVEVSESSAESEGPEEDIVEDFKDGEKERDDEDFVAVGSPKTKKKNEKRPSRGSSSKQSASRKRKCEFCGTNETPMWRRGPTGKGTLCNACGVKWSLKFRKRAGKKTKQEKSLNRHLPREQQRHSTRKKIPAKRLTSADSKEEQSPQDSGGFCCSHSPHTYRKRPGTDDYDHNPLKKRRNSCGGSGEESSFSEEEDATSNRLLGRLLNVVEVQLVEMRQIELVRRQISELRSELRSKEQQHLRQMEQQKAETLHELQNFRQRMLSVTSNAEGSQDSLADSGSHVILDFIATIRVQLNEIRSSMGPSLNWGLGKKLDNFQLELDNLQMKMDEDFSALKAKAANDAVSIQKLFSAKEATLKSGLVSLSRCAEEEFTTMNQRLAKMEDSL